MTAGARPGGGPWTRLASRFGRLTIQGKFTGAIILVMAAALTLSMAAFMAHQTYEFRRAAREESEVIADLVAASSLAPLAFEDRAMAERSLAMLVHRPRVDAARLYLKDGRVLAAFDKRATAFDGVPFAEGVSIRDGWLLRDQVITLDGREEGGLRLILNMDGLRLRLLGATAASLLIALAASFVAFLISAPLRRLLVRPMQDLAVTARRVTGQRDYTARVPVAVQDEMGQLLSDFNEMLSQIETWDLELRRHREQLEQQVTERTRELSAAKVRAESSSLAKSQFLATMSHEIRTPLNGILGMTSLLLDSPLSAQERRFAEDIALSAEALLAVINDVLDFSRLEAGAVKPERLEFDPERIILDVFGLLSIPAREKGLALRLDLPPEAPRTVLGDAGRFRQILLNLVGNAVKFTEAGEVAVAAVPPGTPGGPWTFEVMDTGIGIAPEVLPRLFQPFTQADQSFARRFGGSGLGLSICAKLADLLEGSLEALPRPGGGSIFRLRLPLEACQDPLSVADSTGKRILLAGRPSPTLDSLLRLLRHLGHTVEAVDAMGSIDAGGQGFALAVLVAESTAADMVAAEAAQWALLGRAGQPRLLVRGGTSGQPAGPPVEPDGGTGVLSLPASRAEIGAAVHRLIGPEGSAAPGRDERSERLNKHALVRTDRPQRILVVDDNSLNREIMAKMLERMGHRADVAQDGAEAVASQQADAYDLILMDCQMPVMDGLEATRRIRALENGAARVPIIALTGNAFDEDRQRCLEAGMDDHLPKPVRLDVLRSTLDRWGTA